MKHLGACLQRLPREERFYRHQPSSQLQPTFRPEWRVCCAGPSSQRPEPGLCPLVQHTCPSGPGACGLSGDLAPKPHIHDGLQKVTSVIECQGRVLIGAVESPW